MFTWSYTSKHILVRDLLLKWIIYHNWYSRKHLVLLIWKNYLYSCTGDFDYHLFLLLLTCLTSLLNFCYFFNHYLRWLNVYVRIPANFISAVINDKSEHLKYIFFMFWSKEKQIHLLLPVGCDINTLSIVKF